MHLRNLILGLAAMALPTLAHAATPPGNVAKGQALFKQRCALCHSIVDDTGPRPAPSLKGVFGRKAAAVATFKYSAALKGSGLTWNQANLDKFVAAPGALVKGTLMATPVPIAAERQDVLAYLATLKAGPAAR